MGASGHTQRGIDLLVVPLDSLVAEVQAIRDLSVSEAVGKQAKNRSLPFRQRFYQRCLPTVAHGGGEDLMPNPLVPSMIAESPDGIYPPCTPHKGGDSHPSVLLGYVSTDC